MIGSPKKIVVFFFKVVVRLVEYSEYEEYLANYGEIEMHAKMKNTFKYKSHRLSHNLTLSLIQKYVNADTVC
jgi:hypothetical protein